MSFGTMAGMGSTGESEANGLSVPYFIVLDDQLDSRSVAAVLWWCRRGSFRTNGRG